MNYEGLIPLIYLITVAVITGVLHHYKVPPATIGIIVGAGLMRVKIPKINGKG